MADIATQDDEGASTDRQRAGRAAGWLAGGAVACLVGAGMILWWHGGDAVFASLVTAALAICF